MLLRDAVVLSLAFFVAGCHRNDEERARAKREFERVRAAYEERVAELRDEHPKTSAAARVLASATEPTVAPEERTAAPATSTAPPRRDAPWIADTPVEIAPPAQATATARGVVLNTRDGEIVVSRLGRLSRSPSPGKTPLDEIPLSSGDFGLGFGPSVTSDSVYWISHGSLVRRAFPAHGATGPLEVLARDAFDGTRVATPIPVPGKTLSPIPKMVAYVVRPEKDDGPLLAKLWMEGQPAQLLTAEGNSTHGVGLVQTDDGVLALSVQARMAMTPVHARRIRFPGGGQPLLGDDVVVWVGGGIQPLTEMTLLPTETNLVGLIPHERSMSEFGIARLDIGLLPTMDTKASWILYPNGIDPAPVAAGRLCGEPVFLYAQPVTPAPDSPQELVVRALEGASGARSLRVASGKVFYFASIAEAPGGALAAWVTDRVTAACTVRCQTRPK